MTRQEEKINLENGTLYYEVTFKFLAKNLLPNELYEEIDNMIYTYILNYECENNNIN